MNILKCLSILPSTFVKAKRKLLWPMAVVLMLLHGNVYAACTWGVPSGAIVVGGDFSAPVNPPVGTALGAWSISSVGVLGTCSPGTQIQTVASLGTNWPYSGLSYTEGGQTYAVFQTNVPGVGFVMAGAAISSGSLTPWVPIGNSATTTFNGAVSSIQAILRLRLVSIGPLTPGNYRLNLAQIGIVNTLGPSPLPGTQIITFFGGGISIVIPAITCSLSTSSATFNMGTLATSTFTGGAGSKYPYVANQSLVSGGCNANSVSMTFAGTAAAAPYASAFANSGTAKGVAMELWQANGSQAIPNGGAINFAPQGAGGSYTFSARYVQTAPTVTTGSVSATVTVTLNYQ